MPGISITDYFKFAQVKINDHQNDYMRRISSILLFLFIIGQVNSQQNEHLDRFIDSLFQPIDNKNSPGIAVIVLQDGKAIARKHYGMANLEHQVPFIQKTPVRLGYSGTREFLCVSLALMKAQGLLKFQDRIRNYLPKLPAWSADVTIQDLLNHSSGFDDEWGTMLLMQADMGNRVDKEQLFQLVYNQPRPQVAPGKGYMYSNTDFALLRSIMEMASGQSLPDYIQKNLFGPLGMNNSFMNDNLLQVIPGFAENYNGAGPYFKTLSVKTSPGGNYRFVTTAEDLEKWTKAIEDENSMAAKAISELMKNARPIPVLSPEVHYTFGHEWQKIGSRQIIKHGGVNHDFYITRVPSLGVSIIGLGNSLNNMKKAESVAHFFIPSEGEKRSSPVFPSEAVNVKKDVLATYAGRYFEKTRNTHSSHIPAIRFYDIKFEGDSLLFYYTSNQFFSMLPLGNGYFKDPEYGAVLQFTRPHVDSSMELAVWVPDGTNLYFQRSTNMATPTNEYLQQFTGNYYSPHLDFYCRIVLNEKNELVLKRPTISDKTLVPNGKDLFLFEMESGGGDSWYVRTEFTRNANGQLNGIEMQHIRMMHHRFEKVK